MEHFEHSGMSWWGAFAPKLMEEHLRPRQDRHVQGYLLWHAICPKQSSIIGLEMFARADTAGSGSCDLPS